MQTARIEAELEPTVSPDTSCSVYWLIPDSGPEELHGALAAVTAKSGMEPRGILGSWDQSADLESKSSDIERVTVLEGEYLIGSTRMKGAVLDLGLLDEKWFWPLFAGGVSRDQICGALLPKDTEVRGGWSYSGLQLVLAGASRQVRPGRATHEYVLHTLVQAFLAETLLAGGLAVTRAQAELFRPGIAITGAPSMIDLVADALNAFPTADPVMVERSIYLRGNWLSKN